MNNKKIIQCLVYTETYGLKRCNKKFGTFNSLYKHIYESGHNIF